MTERLSADMDIITQKQAVFDANYAIIKQNIITAAYKAGRKAEDIHLLAATKTVPVEVINHAIKSGIDYIGENRVQEFIAKYNHYAPGAHRHFIGHLQTNKVKDIVGKVEMIQSVDSVRLAVEISKQCQKIGKTMDVLLEVNIGDEESKSGFLAEELPQYLAEIAALPAIRVQGLMCIPPFCAQKAESAKYFSKMYKLFVDIAGKKIDNVNMVYLSMGMSEDYEIAIENGANIVRIGSALFGKR